MSPAQTQTTIIPPLDSCNCLSSAIALASIHLPLILHIPTRSTFPKCLSLPPPLPPSPPNDHEWFPIALRIRVKLPNLISKTLTYWCLLKLPVGILHFSFYTLSPATQNLVGICHVYVAQHLNSLLWLREIFNMNLHSKGWRYSLSLLFVTLHEIVWLRLAGHVPSEGDPCDNVLINLSYGINSTRVLTVQLPLAPDWFFCSPVLWYANILPINSFFLWNYPELVSSVSN